MKTIAECLALNIRERRKQLQLTQERLAERSGLSITTIQQIERQEIWFGKNSIEAIAKGLETSEIALFQQPKDAAATIQEKPDAKELGRLIFGWNALNKHQRRDILREIEVRAGIASISGSIDKKREA